MVIACFSKMPLKRGVQTIAVIEILMGILVGIYFVVTLVQLSSHPDLAHHDHDHHETNQLNSTKPYPTDELEVNDMDITSTEEIDADSILPVKYYIILSSVMGIGCLTQLSLSWLLLSGTSQESVRKLKVWFWISGLLFAIFLLLEIFGVFFREDWEFEISVFFEVIYQVIALWVVRAFINKLINKIPAGFVNLEEDNITTEDAV